MARRRNRSGGRRTSPPAGDPSRGMSPWHAKPFTGWAIDRYAIRVGLQPWETVMAIQFACTCGQQLTAADEHAGKKVRCGVCGAVCVVPIPVSEAVDDEVEPIEEALPADADPADAPPSDRSDAERERGRKKRK